MRIFKNGAAILTALVLSAGAAFANDSAPIVGQWIDKLTNGASMVTVFTDTTISFHGVDPEGKDGPTNTVEVTYSKTTDGAIAITAKGQAGDPLVAKVKDANTVQLQFPGAEPRTLTRQAPAKK